MIGADLSPITDFLQRCQTIAADMQNSITRTQIAGAAGDYAIGQAYGWMDEHRSQITHVYEWGDSMTRLYRFKLRGSGSVREVDYNFVASHTFVPTENPLQTTRHIFVQKADVMEHGLTVHVLPKTGVYLVYPNRHGIPTSHATTTHTDGTEFVFNPDGVTITGEERSKPVGKFEAAFNEFFTGPVEMTMAEFNTVGDRIIEKRALEFMSKIRPGARSVDSIVISRARPAAGSFAKNVVRDYFEYSQNVSQIMGRANGNSMEDDEDE